MRIVLNFRISGRLPIIFFATMLMASYQLFADDEIILYNHTNVPVYAGLYYVDSNIIGVSTGPAELFGEVAEVQPYTDKKLIRPLWRFWTHNREIIFSTSRDALKKNLTKKEYKVSSNKSVGLKFGSIYHIVSANGIVTVHGDIDYKFFQPVIAKNRELITRVFHRTSDFFKQHPYANVKATVRRGFDLSVDEIKAVSNRSIKTKAALESVLKVSLPDRAVPRIGICLSGGGVRIVAASYGLLLGLNEIGLFDAVAYAAGLSGSTWLISSFLEANRSVRDYKNVLLKAITEEHLFAPEAITDTFLQKYVYKQPLSIVDLYGVYLSNKFFRNLSTDIERQRVWFSDLRHRVSDGSFMFPLCTAVEITKSKSNPIWFTFSPYEIGNDQLGLYIPTWSLGRKFFGGVSTELNNPPELRLGFYMGLWGSALSGTFKSMYNIIAKQSIESPIVGSVLENILKQTIGPVQVAPINIANPFYGIDKTDYRDLEQLTLADAGYGYIIPTLPLLNQKRAVDIIIILDASDRVHEYKGLNSLKKSEEHARNLGLKFPHVDYTGITDRPVTVFADSDPKTPIVIYVVPVKNRRINNFDPATEFSTTYATVKFSYSKRDAERLIDLVRLNISDNKEIILDAIRKKIDQKMESNVQMQMP